MSAFHHRAPFPNDIYLQSYKTVFAPDQAILESPPETQVTSQPLQSQCPCCSPKAPAMPYLPPSDASSCSPMSSTPCGDDVPVPLRTGSQRRTPNHVPRPLNCFFLFKTDWLAKRKSLLAGIEQDHRQLNRMASSEWRKLPPETKQRFKDAAYQAKVEHSMKYPGYRFTPKPRGDRRKRKTKRNEPEILLRNEEAARLVSQGVTGDALREALEEYDRRCTDERHHSTNSAPSPSFSEGLPSTPSTLSSVNHPLSSFDVNPSYSWAPQPTTSYVDLETLWETFAGSSHSAPWTGEVALSQHSPVDQPQVVPAELSQDSYLFRFDHLLGGYDSLFSPLYNPSTHFIRTDSQTQHRIDDLEPPVGGTQGTASFPVFQPFKPSSGFIQSTPNTPEGYQSVPLYDSSSSRALQWPIFLPSDRVP